MKKIILILLVLFSITAQARDPFQARMYQKKQYYLSSFLELTATEDNLIIKKVIINRGNCKPFLDPNSQLPRTLKYGQSIALNLGEVSMCRIIETKLLTNKGDFVLNWK